MCLPAGLNVLSLVIFNSHEVHTCSLFSKMSLVSSSSDESEEELNLMIIAVAVINEREKKRKKAKNVGARIV